MKTNNISLDELKEYFVFKDQSFIRIKKTYQCVKLGPVKLSGKIYVSFTHKRRPLLYHRMVFLWHHGYLPINVDHIDLDKRNNLLSNLREADVSKNAVNRKKRAGLSSIYKGVSFHKKTGKWLASCEFGKKENGKRNSKNLGLFETEQKAYEAYLKVAKSYNFEFLNLKPANRCQQYVL